MIKRQLLDKGRRFEWTLIPEKQSNISQVIEIHANPILDGINYFDQGKPTVTL